MNVNPWRVFLKALLLLTVFNFAVALVPPCGCGLSVYNHFVPGRKRLPFGENPTKAYNLSLFDLDAMFAAHEAAAAPPLAGEYRVFVVGDSSVWGTLLRPEETLAGQLNALHLRAPDGRPVRFYNLGYPTIALTKDLLLLDEARQGKPDLILWLVTLEAFPKDKQLTPPLVSHNLGRVVSIADRCGLDLVGVGQAPSPDFWQRTFLSRRRAWADWYRLQVYGVMWWLTGIDQFYPPTYTPAKRDFDADDTFHGLHPGDDLSAALAWNALKAGFCLANDTPVMLINEPILIAQGKNSDLRYNFFYPRWAYDAYREMLRTQADENGWRYADFWDVVPEDQFTNSAVHLTPQGEALLAQTIRETLLRDFSSAAP